MGKNKIDLFIVMKIILLKKHMTPSEKVMRSESFQHKLKNVCLKWK